MEIKYPKIGICGLSCRLCPRYHTKTESKCNGCKSKGRIVVGCPFITCAIKNKNVEFCWECKQHTLCVRWQKSRDFSKDHDSILCRQKLEDNISFILKNGVEEFEKQQKIREQLLKEMLQEFNEGRSKSYYCIAATVLEIEELKNTIIEAKAHSKVMGDIKQKSKVLHSILDGITESKNYCLKLRK